MHRVKVPLCSEVICAVELLGIGVWPGGEAEYSGTNLPSELTLNYCYVLGKGSRIEPVVYFLGTLLKVILYRKWVQKPVVLSWRVLGYTL